MAYKNMQAVRAANRDAGKFWFSPDAMAFWNSRIETALLHGRYFVTSEAPGAGDEDRRYTIRFALDSGDIMEIWEMRDFDKLDVAISVIGLHYRAYRDENGDVPDSVMAPD